MTLQPRQFPSEYCKYIQRNMKGDLTKTGNKGGETTIDEQAASPGVDENNLKT